MKRLATSAAVALLVGLIAVLLMRTRHSPWARLGKGSWQKTRLLTLENDGTIRAVPAATVFGFELYQIARLENICKALEELRRLQNDPLLQLRSSGTLYGLTENGKKRLFPDEILVSSSGNSKTSGASSARLPAGKYSNLKEILFEGGDLSVAGNINSMHVPLHCKGRVFTERDFKGEHEEIVPGTKFDWQFLHRPKYWKSAEITCENMTAKAPEMPQPPEEIKRTGPAPDLVCENDDATGLGRVSYEQLAGQLLVEIDALRNDLHGITHIDVSDDLGSDKYYLNMAQKYRGFTENDMNTLFPEEVELFHQNHFESRLRGKLSSGEHRELKTTKLREYDQGDGSETGTTRSAGEVGVHSISVPPSCSVQMYTGVDYKGNQHTFHAGNYNTFLMQKMKPGSAKVDCAKTEESFVKLSFKQPSEPRNDGSSTLSSPQSASSTR